MAHSDSPAATLADMSRAARPRAENWLCPVCGAVIRDDLIGDPPPPKHEHHGRVIDLIPRAEL